jgi:hypothetical protein
MRLRLLLVNSTVAFAIALPLMITMHEFAHALAGLPLGLRPTVFPGQVTYAPPGTTGQQLVTLLAGPIGSLLIGVVVLLVAPAARGFGGLFLLWLGALSVQEFTGYLMTAPFLAIGDIGSALHLLSAPGWTYWLVLLVGAGGTVLLGREFTRRLLALTGEGDLTAQLRCLGLFAWLIGAVATLLFALVVSAVSGGSNGLFTTVGLVEALATLTSGGFVFGVRFFMGAHVPGRPIAVGWTWPLVGAALWLALGVVRQVVLGPGLQL